MSSGIELPSSIQESNLSGMSIAPVGMGKDFPIAPMPGYLIVRVNDPEYLRTRTIQLPPQARKKEFQKLAQESTMPLTGVVVDIGVGLDKDPDDKRRKPLPVEAGDYFYTVGDTVLFSPAAGYDLVVEGHRLIGDRDIIGKVRNP
jgi:co-chaperonin GroES (HSP10)